MRRQNYFIGAIVAIVSFFGASHARAMTPQQASIVVRAALSQVGTAYVWGAESPGRCFDCSGLTQWAFAQAGIGLPRVSSQQLWACRMCVPLGTPGGILFFSVAEDGVIDHVGIDLGGGYMVDADSVAGRVVVESYMIQYWRARLVVEAQP